VSRYPAEDFDDFPSAESSFHLAYLCSTNNFTYDRSDSCQPLFLSSVPDFLADLLQKRGFGRTFTERRINFVHIPLKLYFRSKYNIVSIFFANKLLIRQTSSCVIILNFICMYSQSDIHDTY
jgi:hypothetical protein